MTTTQPSRVLTPARTWQLAAALLTVYVVWGTTYFAIHVAIQSAPPVFSNSARFLAAGLVMLAVARWRGLAWPTPQQWAHSGLIGLLMVFAAMALVVLAQKNGIGSGLMATVVTSMPMWLALWTRWGGEPVPVTSWIGLGLGAAGAMVLALEGDFSTTVLGSLCAFGAPLCWSLGSYASRKLAQPAPAMAAGVQWLVGGAMGMAVGWLAEPQARSFSWDQLTLASALAWLYLLVFGTLIALNAYLWLLQNASAAVAGSYSFVNPVVALCVGVWLGGERLTGWVFIAMPLILCALALILYGEAVLRILNRARHARRA